MNAGIWLPLSAAVPFLIALGSWWGPWRRRLPGIAPLATLPALGAALALPEDAAFRLAKGHLQAVWQLDSLARSFLLFTAAGWALAAAFAVGHFRRHPRRTGFWIMFLTAMSGNFLLVTAADVVTYYSGFAVMGFAAWALVMFDGTPSALRAGRLYLAMFVLGELLIFPGLVKGVLQADSTRLADVQGAWGTDGASILAVALLFTGFGLKAGAAPLHFWLPIAHPAAPTPASAVLSGCMIKAGVLGWLRLLPVEGGLLPGLALAFAITGAVNLVGGGFAGIAQRDPKAALAYSSIQASGTLMLLMLPMTLSPALRTVALPVIAGYAGFHAMHKVGLFLALGACPGQDRQRRWALTTLAVLAASYAGFPLLAGDRIKAAAAPLWKSLPSPIEIPLMWVVAAGAALTVVLVGRVVWSLRQPGEGASAVPRSTSAAWLLAAAIAVLVPLASPLPGNAWPPGLTTVAPLLAGILLLILMTAVPPLGALQIPPGDIGAAMARLSPRKPLVFGRWVDELEDRLTGPHGAFAVIGLILLLLLAVLNW